MVRLEMDLTQAREQAIQRLGELKDENVNKVLKRSLKRATTTYQTSTKRQTQKKYILKDKSIDDNMRIKPSGNGFFFKTTSRSRLIITVLRKKADEKEVLKQVTGYIGVPEYLRKIS